MPVSLAGPRILLRQLREVMAEPESAQERLDKIVQAIASNMVAEVCSIYVLRAGDELELFASEGLKQEAVHQTRLRVGEGLVGDVAANARPLNLADAQAHPAFAYRPETGEEIYHSFLGVPLLRNGRVLGVLVVQNKIMRTYVEEEIEALQTVAMVLAEMIGSGQVLSQAELNEADFVHSQTFHHEGSALNDGIALGHVVLHQPRVRITRYISDDEESEESRLMQALEELRASIDEMLRSPDLALAGDHRDVLETYRMFARDRGWVLRIKEAIGSGLTAEAAVQRVQDDMRARMSHATDPYLRERLHDLDDLAYRLLRLLTNETNGTGADDLPVDAIVVARTMGPAELLDYERERLRGLVLEEGSPTSHVAIVARALGIPLVGRIEGLLEQVDQGTPIIVDGDTGDVYVRPSQDIIDAYAAKARFRARRQEQYKAIRSTPAVTLDGHEITLNINAGLLVDLPHLHEAGAAGIGLFRTELQFMISSTLPKLTSQTELYRKVMDEAEGKPVVFRTLDVGGDKVLPYLSQVREENPALGWRAIRIALDRPALLRYQIRALLSAAEGRDLSLMFPMVAEVAEFVQARAMVDRELERLDRMGRPRPASLKVGSMLEVPSLAWQLPALFPLVDFISVGSNDLLQFFFASDRGNPRLADRYDLLSPPVLRFLRNLVLDCRRHDVPLAICGEMGGRPLEAMALAGLGFRRFSMPPAAVGPVKMMIRSLKLDELEAYMEHLYDLPDHSVRAKLQNFANDHGIVT